jgi:glutamate/tyrosine decarboxylase-like PLP-dependent enzyme
MTLKEHGVRRLGRAIARNCRQARYLARRVDGSDALERAAPVCLNIVCFRYGAPGEKGDELNRRILTRLHREGTAAPSSTRLDGRLVLRVALTNHRTRREDLDLLVERVTALGRELSGG